MNRTYRVISLLAATLLAGPAAAETVSTFTLDSLSFISFGDQQTVALPAGSTLKFRFGAPAADGSTPFTLEPHGVSIPDVPLPSGGVLRYGLASSTSGTMRSTSEGRQLEFTATVRATLERGSARDGTLTYTMPFTTESTAASNLSRTRTLSVSGMRLVDGVWYGQIVGATTNKENAYPEAGAAVYTVLSGSFDQVP